MTTSRQHSIYDMTDDQLRTRYNALTELLRETAGTNLSAPMVEQRDEWRQDRWELMNLCLKQQIVLVP